MFHELTIQDYLDAPEPVKTAIEKWMNNQQINSYEYNIVKFQFPGKFRQTLHETQKELERLTGIKTKWEVMGGSERKCKTVIRRSKWVC